MRTSGSPGTFQAFGTTEGLEQKSVSGFEAVLRERVGIHVFPLHGKSHTMHIISCHPGGVWNTKVQLGEPVSLMGSLKRV